MIQDRQEMDNRVTGARTIERVASDLGLQREGRHFFCPGCQPEEGGKPDLVIKNGRFHCFRCGAMGDVVGLVKLSRKCDSDTAIEWLSQELN